MLLPDIADNEELQVLWVGQSASPKLLLDLFGVDDIFKVDIRIVRAHFKNNQIFFRQRKVVPSPLPPLPVFPTRIKDGTPSFGHPLL